MTLWLLWQAGPSWRVALPGVEGAADSVAATHDGTGWLSCLLAVWAIGCAFRTARLGVGVLRLRLLVRRSTVCPAEWQRALARLAQRLGVRQGVQLRISEQVDAPIVLGWLRPVIPRRAARAEPWA
jgi:beta-lactamase regulating signal transducer with metallopeptidase domain